MNYLNEKKRIYTFEDSNEVAEFYEKISGIMEKIHNTIPKENYKLNQIAKEIEIREECFDHQNYKRVVIYLQSNGCEWALKNGNGCTMCGHLAKQAIHEKKITIEDYMSQFENEFKKFDFEKYPILNLFNNGSFLNENEIQKEAQSGILKMVQKNPYIKVVVLETRPEFVTEERIQMVKKYLPDKRVEIAIGLEMMDDDLRFICINKGFTRARYEKAAKIIVKNLHLRTYVLLKPPFLTEKESVHEAVRTIEYAFSLGCETVSLETCTIQDYTLVKYLSDRNAYKTSWLWSIVEVVKRTAHLGKVIVGMFQFYPSPVKVPYNCEKCSDRVLAAIKKYNETLDVTVLDNLDCECKAEWKKEYESEAIPFPKRLNVLDGII